MRQAILTSLTILAAFAVPACSSAPDDDSDDEVVSEALRSGPPPSYYDWVLPDVCASAKGIVSASPLSCPPGTRARDIRFGEPLVYTRSTVDGKARSFAHPIQGPDGKTWVLQPHEFGPQLYDHNLDRDGWESINDFGDYVGAATTSDRATLGSGEPYRATWRLDGDTCGLGAVYYPKTLTLEPGRLFILEPLGAVSNSATTCPAQLKTGTVAWEYEKSHTFVGQGNRPLKLPALKRIASYGREHMEISYFTREFGASSYAAYDTAKHCQEKCAETTGCRSDRDA